jgi:hypothetical protein
MMYYYSIVMDYLNHNSGAVQVVLTAIYVIATIYMLISMLRGNRLVRENVRLITKMETERLRPLVYFDLVADGAVEAIVKNIGATAAYDIKIDLSPKIKTDDRLRNGELSLTTSTIAFKPGRKATRGNSPRVDGFVTETEPTLCLYSQERFSRNAFRQNAGEQSPPDQVRQEKWKSARTDGCGGRAEGRTRPVGG